MHRVNAQEKQISGIDSKTLASFPGECECLSVSTKDNFTKLTATVVAIDTLWDSKGASCGLRCDGVSSCK